ncbi:MAG: copper resistance CopC family protein [Acidobacteriaceae bacterium]
MRLARAGSVRLGSVLLLSMLLLAWPHAALAHAVLVSSTPGEHATVKSGALDITLTYNSRIDAARCSLALVSPQGAEHVLTIDPHAAPNVLKSKAQVSKGEYTVRWQVLASDGHITRGVVAFSVQ